MKTNIMLLNELPLEPFDHPQLDDEWARSPLSTLPDQQLIEAVIAVITPPKMARPSSFVLHAPLELLARAALLPYVRINTQTRAQARRQIAAVAVRYAHAGPAVENPKGNYTGIETALPALINGLREGDANGVDAALLFLLPRVPLLALRKALIDEIVPRLGAAGHAPILLAALARELNTGANRYPNMGGLLRAPLRTLAGSPELRLSWYEASVDCIVPSVVPLVVHNASHVGSALFDCLAAPARVLLPSTSIAPMLMAVEQNGDAARLLQEPLMGLSPQRATQVLLRVAAQAMLQDDPAEAPYGWSHCLTLPQGLLQNAEASSNHHALIAVAATHVLACRAVMGKMAIRDIPPPPVPPPSPSRPSTRLVNFAEAEPSEAASIAFHAHDVRRNEIVTMLATEAAIHPDAHLAKYTLACFEAAANDPQTAPLFIAAAAYLGTWWRHEERV
jgi:hypothetical protein